MKIPNPWPHQAHIRFNVNNGECTGSCGGGPEIEVPDTAVEVLIEPCARGRYDSKTLAPGRMWSEEFGMLDVADHLKKLEIKKEGEALKAQQAAARLRMQGEAKAKAEAEAAKAKAKAKAMEASEAEAEAEALEVVEAVEAAIKVDRAASGLAKVTKELKPKK